VVEEHDYRAYEPFDGLSSPLRSLTFKNLLLDRLLAQTVRQNPFNLRPFLRNQAAAIDQRTGYMGWGYLTMLKDDRGF